jgi:hypothetical protein
MPRLPVRVSEPCFSHRSAALPLTAADRPECGPSHLTVLFSSDGNVRPLPAAASTAPPVFREKRNKTAILAPFGSLVRPGTRVAI